jgi:hypothetical protein
MITKSSGAKRYVRAGTRIYDYHLDLPVHGELVRCKRCGNVLFGTFFKLHDHWHTDHEDECDWEEFLAAIGESGDLD